MHNTHLRKVGGSVMLAVPPAVLEMLELSPGSVVGVTVDGGRLIIEPHKRQRYTLDELLSQCDPDAPMTDAESEWLGAPAKGAELI
jgi:antitoxin ChpS